MNKNKIVIIFTIAILLIMVGMKLNFTTMISNGGRMPLKWDYYSTEIDEYVLWNNKAQVEYWYLGDNIKLWIIMFSIGDLLILSGFMITIIMIIKSVRGKL